MTEDEPFLIWKIDAPSLPPTLHHPVWDFREMQWWCSLFGIADVWRTTLRSFWTPATSPPVWWRDYRLDDDICFIMPWGDPCWTLKSYIDFALWMKGSAFTVGKADVEDFISIQPYHADFSQHLPRAQPAIIPTQHRSEVGYTDHTWGNISGVRRHGGKPRPHSYHWGWVVTGLWRSVGTITSSLPSSSVWSSYLLAPSSPCLQSSLFPSSLKSLCWFRPALNLLFLRWFHMALNLLCFLCVPPALTLLYPSNSHPSSLSHLCCLVLLV